MDSLCASCSLVREVVSGTGSRFLLCQLSQTDKRFPKYPAQPVRECPSYQSLSDSPMSYKLEVLPDTLAICRLAASDAIPNWVQGDFVVIARTPTELSIVCQQSSVPTGIKNEPNWRCLRVAGPLDFRQVGIIASLATILAAEQISVFVVSTFDTDYLLVKAESLLRAITSLRKARHDCRLESDN